MSLINFKLKSLLQRVEKGVENEKRNANEMQLIRGRRLALKISSRKKKVEIDFSFFLFKIAITFNRMDMPIAKQDIFNPP